MAILNFKMHANNTTQQVICKAIADQLTNPIDMPHTSALLCT